MFKSFTFSCEKASSKISYGIKDDTKIDLKIFCIHPLIIVVWSLASRCRVSMNRILGNHFTKFGYPQLETPYPNQPYGTYFWYVIGEVSWLSQSIVGSERPNCYARKWEARNGSVYPQLEGPSLENRLHSGLCLVGFQGHSKRTTQWWW